MEPDLANILSKVNLAEYVSGFVTGVLACFGFMQRTFISDYKARILELNNRIEVLETRLIHLEDSRVQIALNKSSTTPNNNNSTDYRNS